MNLLEDYAGIARRRGVAAVERSALRVRSLAYRDLIAHLAGGGGDWLALAKGRHPHVDLDPAWLAALGRVIGLQDLLPGDQDAAVRLLASAVDRLPASAALPYRRLLVELLFALGRFDESHAVLAAEPQLRDLRAGYLWTDHLNPWIDSPFADASEWRDRFAAMTGSHGLAPAGPAGNAAVPFDALRAPSLPRIDGPLVSVIMTTYRPGRDEAVLSARSILRQTWQNVELIVVDDCSSGYADVLDELRELDPRVRIVSMEENGGTYLARNRGIAEARGAYVANQDADDWAHPERLARQVAALAENSGAAACRARALTVTENLVLQRPGYAPTAPDAATMLLRTDVVREIGGFLPARKGADTELLERLAVYTGTPTVTVDLPLAIKRIRTESLSRSDFLPGWHHPARRAFKSSYRRWHATSNREGLRLHGSPPPVRVPHRFVVRPEKHSYDVVLAGEWQQYGGPQKSMIEEIHALTAAGKRVAVLALEAARFMSRHERPLCAPVQDLINAGVVDQVVDDDPVHARLVVVRYPPVLQFPPAAPLSIHADHVVVLANQAPSERDGTDVRYRVEDCSENAERMFGRRALWVPQGPVVRAAIADTVREGELAGFDIPGILHVDDWAADRSFFRSTVPVIGRHSRDNVMKWPDTAKALGVIYPVDGSVDVRIMGGVEVALRVLGVTSTPPGWVSFPRDYLDVRTFLASIDFFVYFQHPQAYDAFGRAVLEALATGCVCVLPREMEPTFGAAAIYADEAHAMQRVWELYREPTAYRAQSERALAHVRRHFSREAYLSLVDTLAGQPDDVVSASL